MFLERLPKLRLPPPSHQEKETKRTFKQFLTSFFKQAYIRINISISNVYSEIQERTSGDGLNAKNNTGEDISVQRLGIR